MRVLRPKLQKPELGSRALALLRHQRHTSECLGGFQHYTCRTPLGVRGFEDTRAVRRLCHVIGCRRMSAQRAGTQEVIVILCLPFFPVVFNQIYTKTYSSLLFIIKWVLYFQVPNSHFKTSYWMMVASREISFLCIKPHTGLQEIDYKRK